MTRLTGMVVRPSICEINLVHKNEQNDYNGQLLRGREMKTLSARDAKQHFGELMDAVQRELGVVPISCRVTD